MLTKEQKNLLKNVHDLENELEKVDNKLDEAYIEFIKSRGWSISTGGNLFVKKGVVKEQPFYDAYVTECRI